MEPSLERAERGTTGSGGIFGKASSGLRKNGNNRYDLTMEGKLEPGWVGRLCTCLGRQEINIVRGNAAKVSTSEWSSLFDLDFPKTVRDPGTIDFVALMREERTCQGGAAVVLYDYLLEQSEKYGGTLYVEVTGQDRVGFLSSILNCFSLFSLFPTEMVVETKENRVFDRFWLKGMGGMPPSGAAATALGDTLKGYIQTSGGNA
jgi:predicted amino acid-binding ACT domain protein